MSNAIKCSHRSIPSPILCFHCGQPQHRTGRPARFLGSEGTLSICRPLRAVFAGAQQLLGLEILFFLAATLLLVESGPSDPTPAKTAAKSALPRTAVEPSWVQSSALPPLQALFVQYQCQLLSLAAITPQEAASIPVKWLAGRTCRRRRQMHTLWM